MSEETTTVLTLSLGGQGFTVPWEERAFIMDELEAAADADDVTTYEIRVHKMTRAALEALPEFDGF